jgi:Periplasmic binding protein
MRRRAFIAACLAGVLSLTAVGCAAQEGTAANGEIPIGVNIELTGPASLLGASYKNALDLVVADINRQGVLDGRKLELIVRDNRSDPAEATRVAKNLWTTSRSSRWSAPVSRQPRSRWRRRRNGARCRWCRWPPPARS